MSVVEVTAGDIKYDTKGVRTTTRRWLVDLGASASLKDAILSIPVQRYDPHPLDSGMLALEATGKRVSDLSLGKFYVEVEYSSEAFDQGNTGSQPSQNSNETPPPQRPWLITTGSVTREVVLGPKDFTDGTPKDVVNAAGQPYADPPLMRHVCHTVLTIKGFKELGSVNVMDKMNTFRNTTNKNAATFAGYSIPVNMGLVTKFDWQQQYDQGQYFWAFELGIEINPDTWALQVANVGTTMKISSSVPACDIIIRGVPVTKPVPLAADGTRPLNPGEPLNYITFQPYKLQNWTGIV